MKDMIAIVAASASESADTRNWQTLPHSMYYTRVPVEKGSQKLTLSLNGPATEKRDFELEIDAKKGKTLIYPFWTLASQEPNTLNRAK